MTNAVLIFVAGGCGSVLRYLVGLAVPSALFPWVTLGGECGRQFRYWAFRRVGGAVRVERGCEARAHRRSLWRLYHILDIFARGA